MSQTLLNAYARIGAMIGRDPSARGARAAQAAAGNSGQPANSAELWLYGVVGGYWFGFDAKSVADQLRGLDVDFLTVRLHSPGGSSIEGIAIGNLLRNHKARVTVVIDGLAASAASVIALAGDEVVMSPGSQFMIHDVWLCTCGNAAELRSDADFLDKQSQNYAEVYASRGIGTAEECRAAMLADNGAGTWYTAQEAVAAGFADRIGTITSTSSPPAEPAPEDMQLDGEEAAARAAWDLDVLVHPAARAAWSERAPKPPTASAGGSTETEGGSAVAFSDEQIANLRSTLGVADDADEATMLAAAEALATTETAPPAGSTPVVPEGMALVDAAVLTQVQADAAAGRAAQQTLADQERDRALNQALADGKIAATSRDRFAEAWDKDATSTRAILDSLTPGLVPTAEVGHEGEPADLDGIEINDAELEALASGFGLSKEAYRG